MNKQNIIKLIIVCILLIIAYLFALNGRYSKVEDNFYFDKWKQCIIEVE